MLSNHKSLLLLKRSFRWSLEFGLEDTGPRHDLESADGNMLLDELSDELARIMPPTMAGRATATWSMRTIALGASSQEAFVGDRRPRRILNPSWTGRWAGAGNTMVEPNGHPNHRRCIHIQKPLMQSGSESIGCDSPASPAAATNHGTPASSQA
ncbi:hypothetical protein VTN77DRAFT_2401 [Rasamsonia byssochlamydoides]|uniref:uncharacterized protein n=1 Tax=Rasamsonia byssochlamydoides TaxID=89139 RepID=UPI003743230F